MFDCILFINFFLTKQHLLIVWKCFFFCISYTFKLYKTNQTTGIIPTKAKRIQSKYKPCCCWRAVTPSSSWARWPTTGTWSSELPPPVWAGKARCECASGASPVMKVAEILLLNISFESAIFKQELRPLIFFTVIGYISKIFFLLWHY